MTKKYESNPCRTAHPTAEDDSSLPLLPLVFERLSEPGSQQRRSSHRAKRQPTANRRVNRMERRLAQRPVLRSGLGCGVQLDSALEGVARRIQVHVYRGAGGRSMQMS